MGWFFGTDCDLCGKTIEGEIIYLGNKKACLSCSKKIHRDIKKKDPIRESKNLERRLKENFEGIAKINILNFNKNVATLEFPWKLKITNPAINKNNLQFFGKMETDLNSVKRIIDICRPICPKYRGDWQNLNIAISNLIQSQLGTELFEWKMTRKKYNITVNLIIEEGKINKLTLVSN